MKVKTINIKQLETKHWLQTSFDFLQSHFQTIKHVFGVPPFKGRHQNENTNKT